MALQIKPTLDVIRTKIPDLIEGIKGLQINGTPHETSKINIDQSHDENIQETAPPFEHGHCSIYCRGLIIQHVDIRVLDEPQRGSKTNMHFPEGRHQIL